MFRKYAMAAIVAAGAFGAGFVVSAPVSAMPMVTVHSDGMPLVRVRDGCGRGWHLNRWGRCVPNRRYHHYRHYGWYQPYYYREWHRPHHRHWRHHDNRRHHHDRHHWRR
ncbi:GCG_CRPN prefix-to-repeats domain-containing protein [Mesorhizobium koreense]|jgi:hypothetical protein|uniref:GCG_CRPN prefix-to-repeats domain-containing protein n=1 Tax=Mesorhizobium koreense TaxID=3074855 RepID=UPI00287BC228|nr:hypothetical protein [Mesorhizobium sp. WR6]